MKNFVILRCLLLLSPLVLHAAQGSCQLREPLGSCADGDIIDVHEDVLPKGESYIAAVFRASDQRNIFIAATHFANGSSVWSRIDNEKGYPSADFYEDATMFDVLKQLHKKKLALLEQEKKSAASEREQKEYPKLSAMHQ